MKVESITIMVLALCIFLSFYFTYLSFQTMDDTFKKQLVVLAASSLIAGVVLFACMTIYLGIRRAFSRFEDQLINIEEPTEEDS
ncbi:hypothetical protein HXY33_07000 [Candidatus Bathyarchaeota archaeon]|nr:hypothetical protein [Candidatus Bathyarchaeota archaeon]